MIYKLTTDPNRIFCVDTNESIPRDHKRWEDYEQFLADGGVPLPIPPPYLPNTPGHHRAIRDAAWEWMDSAVKARGYDNIETCVGYYNSGVERYRLEARAMVAWRDAVNQKLEQLVLNPPAGLDTWDEVRALLPQPEAYPWPPKLDLPLGTVRPVGL